MKITRPGEIPKSNPAARWVEMQFTCPNCNCIAEIEATDQPSFGNRTGQKPEDIPKAAPLEERPGFFTAAAKDALCTCTSGGATFAAGCPVHDTGGPAKYPGELHPDQLATTPEGLARALARVQRAEESEPVAKCQNCGQQVCDCPL